MDKIQNEPYEDLSQRLRSMILANSRTNEHSADPNGSQKQTSQTFSINGDNAQVFRRNVAVNQRNKNFANVNTPVDRLGSTGPPGPGETSGRARGNSSRYRVQSDRHDGSPQTAASSRGRYPQVLPSSRRSRGMTPLFGGRGQTRDGRGGSSSASFRVLDRPKMSTPEQIEAQCLYLEKLAEKELPLVEMTAEEFSAKEAFRCRVKEIALHALADAYQLIPPFDLVAFGSLASGFSMPGSDLDLALLVSDLPPAMPRLLEQAFLSKGFGARLLTRTRVPILKLCERPTADLYDALCTERGKWDELTPEQKEEHDHRPTRKKEPENANVPNDSQGLSQPPGQLASTVKPDINGGNASLALDHDMKTENISKFRVEDSLGLTTQENSSKEQRSSRTQSILNDCADPRSPDTTPTPMSPEDLQYFQLLQATRKEKLASLDDWIVANPPPPNFDLDSALYTVKSQQPPKRERPWLREKPLGPLDFPKDTVGVLCDINFSNPLGIHNTALLHAYSTCDLRVRLMVLFVKLWASRRKINSGYNGTLSSYGYVLMVLHFLVNVASPPVCPNLQLWQTQKLEQTKVWPPQRIYFPPDPKDPMQICEGADIRFHRNETELASLASRGLLTRNRATIGSLLRDFFEYYGGKSFQAPKGGFTWTRDVLSLRSPGGLMSKVEKGWTGARTTAEEGGREVRHRYLFAIEDPFEIEHNVARTVTHHGIVAIRDEFRRCVRILDKVGKKEPHEEGELLETVVVEAPEKEEEEERKGGQ